MNSRRRLSIDVGMGGMVLKALSIERLVSRYDEHVVNGKHRSGENGIITVAST
jgi:hypothetical protein